MVQNIAAKRNEPLIPIHDDDMEDDDGNSSSEEADDGQSAADDVSRATQNAVRAKGQAYRDRLVENYF